MAKRFTGLLIALAMAVFFAAGCSAGPPADQGGDRGGVEAPATDDGDYSGEKPGGNDGDDITTVIPLDGQQKLIRSGAITLRAENIDTAQEEIRSIATRYSGYIYSLRQVQASERRNLEVTIKVTAENFDAAMDDIKKLGSASDINLTVRDVTSEFIDTEARIATLKVKEETLTGILAQATRIEDILLIENNLQQTRQEIESNQGRLNALRNSTDYSTISITIMDNQGLAKTEEPIPPGEVDEVDAGMRCHVVSDLGAPTRDGVENSRGQAGLQEDLRQMQGRDSPLGRRL